jgi:hypothetical protein
VLNQVEAEYTWLIALQPRTHQYYTPAEYAQEIGAHPDTARAMIRDGLVEAHKRPNGHWCFPIAEAERFRRGTGETPSSGNPGATSTGLDNLGGIVNAVKGASRRDNWWSLIVNCRSA